MVNTATAIDYPAIIAQDGYCIVRGLLSPSEAANIRSAFFQLAESVAESTVEGLFEPVGDGNDPLQRYPRVMMPHRRPDLPVGKLAWQYLFDKRIWDILRSIMGEEPLAAQSMFYFKPPGARGQAYHQDNYYLNSAPRTCMAAWIAVEDIDDANGCLSVVPGSHRLPILPPVKADLHESFTEILVPPPHEMKARPAHMKAGDVLFFGGNVIHGSNSNRTSDRFRSSLIYHFIGESSTQVSQWYRPCLRANGQPATISYLPSRHGPEV
jgi:phytanoyl-CoA hydroxylase